MTCSKIVVATTSFSTYLLIICWKRLNGCFSNSCHSFPGMGEGEANINTVLTDDDLQAVLSKLKHPHDRDVCGLVCKRWLTVQDMERKSMRLRAGPLMLERVAARFSYLTDLDMSETVSRSYYPGWKDADLSLVARSFRRLERLNLQGCKGL